MKYFLTCLTTIVFGVFLSFGQADASSKKSKFQISADSEKGMIVFVLKRLDGAASLNVGAVDIEASQVAYDPTGFMVMAGKPTTIFSPVPEDGSYIDPITGTPQQLAFAKKNAPSAVYAIINAINLDKPGKKQAGCYSKGAVGFEVLAGKINLVLVQNPQLDYSEKDGEPWDIEANITAQNALKSFLQASNLPEADFNRVVIAKTYSFTFEKTRRRGSYLCFPPKSKQIRLIH